MKPRPRIIGRATSLAHAFVHAIIPRQVNPDKQRSLYEAAGLSAGDCAYCGNLATDGDHFRGLVKGARPSGHFHTEENIVPSCGTCNQSKGSQHWRSWMLGDARGSPTTRNVQGIAARVERLAAFEALSKAVAVSPADLREMAGAELWDDYWNRLDRIKIDLKAADEASAVIRDRLDEALRTLSISN